MNYDVEEIGITENPFDKPAVPVQTPHTPPYDDSAVKADVAKNKADVADAKKAGELTELKADVGIAKADVNKKKLDELEPKIDKNTTDVSKNAKDIADVQALIASDDTTLDELQEVVDFIKANKDKLDKLTIANIAGLQAKLDELKKASDDNKALADANKVANEKNTTDVATLKTEQTAQDAKIDKNVKDVASNKTDIDKLKADLTKAIEDIAKLDKLKAEIIDNDIAEPKLRWTDKEGVTHDFPISPVSDKSYWADGSFDIKHIHREKPVIMAKKMINIDLADIVDGDKFHFIVTDTQGGFTAKNGNGMIINTLMDGVIAPMPDMMLPFTVFKQGSVVEMYFAKDASGKLQGWIKEVRSIPTNMLVRVEHTNGLEGEGTPADKLNVKLSADAHNMLRFGTDKGLFNPNGGHEFKNGNFSIDPFVTNMKNGDSFSVTIQDIVEIQSMNNFTPIVNGVQGTQVKKIQTRAGDFVVVGMRGKQPTISVFEGKAGDNVVAITKVANVIDNGHFIMSRGSTVVHGSVKGDNGTLTAFATGEGSKTAKARLIRHSSKAFMTKLGEERVNRDDQNVDMEDGSTWRMSWYKSGNDVITEFVQLAGADLDEDATYKNGWETLGTAEHRAFGFTKIGRVIHLRGVMHKGAERTVVGVLPEIARPKTRKVVLIGSTNGRELRIDVNTNGEVYVYSGLDNWLSLDGLSFVQI